MVVFIDDEKWIIEAYLDELQKKSETDLNYKPKHFFYPKKAFDFLMMKYQQIKVIIIDIGMDYGDGNIMNNEPGGIQFYKELIKTPNLNKIPVIILTIYPRSQISKVNEIELDNNPKVTYIHRDQSNRNELFWQKINEAILLGHF